MKIGVVIPRTYKKNGDSKKLFDSVKTLGFEGVQFRSLLQLSESVEASELEECRLYAEELGLFIDFEIGWLNPFNANLNPEIYDLGEGDYLHALQLQLKAMQKMGNKEIVGEIGGVKKLLNGRHAFDRFRTDVTWTEQIYQSEKLIKKIRPILKETGIRIDLENHEDLTTLEFLRLVDKIGPQYLGFLLDVANLVVLGESPVEGARRMAPYVHFMHIKDILLIQTETGLLRQIRPAGDGVIEWETIIPEIYHYDPNVHLLIEDHKGLVEIEIHDDKWLRHLPNLDKMELKNINSLAETSQNRVERGEIENFESYESIPYEKQRIQRLTSSVKFLKSLREKYKLFDKL